MGLAATQGRFLGLTARKSNVEFEGQQVNQARTALSNQSANYNTQTLGMNVPVPPSATQFTKTTYSWTDLNNVSNVISSLTPIANPTGTDNYNITTTTNTTPQPAYIQRDSTGRMTNITIANVPYALTVSNDLDEASYDQAMQKYEYDKDIYTKNIDDVNAKLSVLQSQDKGLELKLKQLDTEQQAIQTEMDAVSKVIDKNIESTFKTFG